jgi:hypothetical protein
MKFGRLLILPEGACACTQADAFLEARNIMVLMAVVPEHLTVDDLEKWKSWQQLPRPRPVRHKRGYGFWIVLVFVALGTIPILISGFLFMEYRGHALNDAMSSDFWRAVPFIIGPLLFLLLGFVMLRKNRQLASSGEIAIGKVTDIQRGPGRGWHGLGRRRRGRTVTYEFSDISGALIDGSFPDSRGSIAKGTLIPVFFDRENPAGKQICLFESLYEIADDREAVSV